MFTNKKGFTLVELIVVIAIMAVLAGTVTGTVVGVLNKAKNDNSFSEAQVIAKEIHKIILEDSDAYIAYNEDGTINSITVNSTNGIIDQTHKKLANVELFDDLENDIAKAGEHKYVIFNEGDTIWVCYLRAGNKKVAGARMIYKQSKGSTPDIAPIEYAVYEE